MSKRLMNYFSYLWNRNKGINAKALFNDLPTSMRADVAVLIGRQMFEKVCLSVCLLWLL